MIRLHGTGFAQVSELICIESCVPLTSPRFCDANVKLYGSLSGGGWPNGHFEVRLIQLKNSRNDI